MSLKVLDATATARALPWVELIDELRGMLARRRQGLTRSPERLAVPLSGGILLAMPATDGEYASTKLVTVCTGNAERGLPVILGELILMRADTGERLLMLDGPTATARRTAAMTALAAIELGAIELGATGLARHRSDGTPANRPDSMLIVGSGAQAQAHLEVFTEVMGVRKVWVCSRHPDHARAFAGRARAAGVDCETVESPDMVAADAGIIVTATTSLQPVLADEPGLAGFIAAVGAFRTEMCELPASLVRRARLLVDDKAGARHEAGDLIQARIDWNQVTALEDAIALGERPTSGPIVFKSVGQALWDLAACRLALRASLQG
jgi:1-piperideine-2-carboxylate/1-pyrroline-2-carboxylate reductase [NAD(P)H]